MKVKVSEASGPVLDWMVANCEDELDRCDYYLHESTGAFVLEHGEVSIVYSPSTKWAQAGPIIEREKISIRQWTNVPIVHAYLQDGEWSSDESSPLIAAMRCYVASKLGQEVEVPDELAYPRNRRLHRSG